MLDYLYWLTATGLAFVACISCLALVGRVNDYLRGKAAYWQQTARLQQVEVQRLKTSLLSAQQVAQYNNQELERQSRMHAWDDRER